MKIINKALLKEFAKPGKCEWCGKQCDKREAHHWKKRGMGGGSRLDISLNLISVGASEPFPRCPCHGMMESGEIEPFSVLAVIAAREGQSQEWIKDEINRVLALPKGSVYP